MRSTKGAVEDPWANRPRTGTNGRVRPKKVSSPAWVYSARAQPTEGAVRYKRQTISRVQDGKYGLGANQTYRRIRQTAARQDRYWLLRSLRQGAAMQDRLYDKLQWGVDVDPLERGRRQKCLAATTMQRRQAWQRWLGARGHSTTDTHQVGSRGEHLGRHVGRRSAIQGKPVRLWSPLTGR